MLGSREELRNNIIPRVRANDSRLFVVYVPREATQEDLAQLFEALKGNTTLIELNLSFAPVTESNISVLFRILGTTKLKMLKLQSNHVFSNSDDEECPVNDFSVHALSQYTRLKHLDVSYSKALSDDGVEALAKMPLETLYVRDCPRVTTRALRYFFNHEYLLDLRVEHIYMKVSPEDRQKLNTMMEKNRHIYRMNVHIGRVVERYPDCIPQLPVPLRSVADNYSQNEFGAHVDTRSLVFNVSKLKTYDHDEDLIAAVSWSQEYKKLCVPETPSPFFSSTTVHPGFRQPSPDIGPETGGEFSYEL